MKKIVLGVLMLVVLAIGALVFYVYSNINDIVKAAIEKYGTQVTQTAVRVEDVDLKLSQGAGVIRGLTIANPSGYSEKRAFSLGSISAGIDIDSIMKDPIIIDHIAITAPRVFFEMADVTKTNLDELKNNIVKSTAQPAPSNDQATSGGKEVHLLIRRLTFSDGSIQAKVVPLDNKQYLLKLPDIEMNNIGGTNGAAPPEIGRQILKRLTDQARDAIKKQGIDAEVDKLKARAKERAEVEKQKLKAKAEERLDSEKSKLDEKLKGLLGR